MNTLFAIFLLGFLYYLFFHPLSAQEWREWANLEEEFVEGNDDHPYI